MTRARGFTLIEMAIVLVIITILIGGLAMPLSAQIQARRIAETNKTLDEAREAIFGYAMSHTTTSSCSCIYHPIVDGIADSTTCPATVTCPVMTMPSIPPSDTILTLTIPTRHYLPCPDKDGDGVEEPRVGGACPQSEGYLPWVTLGTGIQDAWGNHLRYAVTDAFSNSAGFSNTDTGDLQICNASANTGANDCTPGNVAANVPVVLVSHGPNGWGARNINGTTLANPSSNDEKENDDTVPPPDKEFVSRTPSDDFDDLVKWISADQLRGRICSAGGCP